MKFLTATAFVFAIALAGCASVATVNVKDPDRFAANETKYGERATIYVFRGTSRSGALWSYPVGLDQNKIGSIRREQYIAFPATVGSHWLTITCAAACGMPGFKINLDVSAPKSYYFMIEPDVTFGNYTNSSTSQITQIEKRFAERLIAAYEAVEPTGL